MLHYIIYRKFMGKNERRVMVSHKDGRELFDLADAIAKAENPQLFFDGQKAVEDGTTRQPEWRADKQQLKDTMESRLEGGVMRDFISELSIRD